MKFLEDVQIFHAKMGFYPHNENEVKFQDVLDKRRSLLTEETTELSDASDSGDRVSSLHELIDCLYVVYGAACELEFTGAEIEAGWNSVHSANMEKEAPSDPLGKAGKPEGWEKADVSKALGVTRETSSYHVSFVKGGEINQVVFDVQGDLTRTALLNISDRLDGSTIISIYKLG